MTRGQVLQLGLILLAVGGLVYEVLDIAGLEGARAGIVAEALLVMVVMIWTGSYLFRVVTGKMTFMEQRRRYREIYDDISTEAIKARFDAMSEEEQQALLAEIGQDNASSQSSPSS